MTRPPPSLTLFVPGKLENPTNARWHWAGRHRWARQWKDKTAVIVHIADAKSDLFRRLRTAVAGGAGLTVTFEGHVGRRFDDDGFQAACKPVRDAIAELLGTHDGPGSDHAWAYFPQVVQRDRMRQGVTITVRLREETTP